MRPTFVVLHVQQGATFTDSLTLTDKDTGQPVDLTGRNIRMQARDDMTNAVKLDLSTINGTIAAPSSDGKILFHIPADQLAAIAIDLDYETWPFDIELYYTSGSEEIVERPIRGVVIFWPEITV